MDVNAGAKRFEGRQEKSTAILLAIIVVFVSCHFLRFLVQIYIVFSSPLHGSQKLFEVRFSLCLSLAAFSINIWRFFSSTVPNFVNFMYLLYFWYLAISITCYSLSILLSIWWFTFVWAGDLEGIYGVLPLIIAGAHFHILIA